MSRRTLLIGCGNAGLLHEFDPKRRKPASLWGGMKAFPETFVPVGFCDQDPERLADAGRLVPGVPLFRNGKEALESLAPEVVVIATWTESHPALFREALRSGVGGIILEKPVAKTLGEAEGMLRSWRQSPVPVVVNHERRWSPYYRKALRLLREGAIGDLRSAYGRIFLGFPPSSLLGWMREKEGGGALLHDGTHLIDLFLWFFGSPLQVEGALVKERGGIDSQVTTLLRAPGNIPLVLESGGDRRFFEFRLDIEGSEGCLRIGNGCAEIWRAKESPRYSGYREVVQEPFPPLEGEVGAVGFAGPFWELDRALERGSVETFSSLEDGVRVLRVIDKIRKMGERKRR